MPTVSVNGVTYTSSRTISINGNRVVIDGNDITPDSKQITISVVGSINSITADYVDTVVVNGNVGTVKTMSGDVDVSGSVDTMSGDVHCGSIGGDVSTMSGDVRRK